VKLFSLSVLVLSLSSSSIRVLSQDAVSVATMPPLKLVDTISLPAAIKGNFDHLAVDLDQRRLIVTPEDSHSVLVLDLETKKIVHQIDGIERPHAVLVRADLHQLYVTDGGDGSLKVFDSQTYQLRQRIPLLKDADSIGYDPSTKRLYVDNGGKDVGDNASTFSVIDTTESKKMSDIKIAGDTLEAMVLDGRTNKLYLNDPAKNNIVVLDRWTNRVINTWPITLGTKNVAIAQDEYRQRLFVACRSGQLVVLDTSTGKELKAYPISHGVDDLVYDTASRRLYAAGDGTVTIYEDIDANHLYPLGNVVTGPNGRTALLVPALSRYYVAVPQHGSRNAAILVYETVFSPTNMPVAQPAPWKAAYTVEAPAAEHLVLSTLSAHPILRTLGIHGVAPGQTTSVILANANQRILGKPTSDRDFSNLGNGKTFAYKDDDGLDYDLWLELRDAAGRHIGLLVTEIPFTAAANEQDAIRQAESIRQEMATQIPDLKSLFAQRSSR